VDLEKTVRLSVCGDEKSMYQIEIHVGPRLICRSLINKSCLPGQTRAGSRLKDYVGRSRSEKSDDDGFADGWQKQLFHRFARGRQGGFMIELDRRKRIVMDPNKF
jgi:hypothetical protein